MQSSSSNDRGKSRRRLCSPAGARPICSSATRRFRRILPYFDHFRFRFGQFRDLVHIHQFATFFRRTALTAFTNLRFHFHFVLWIGNQLALVFHVKVRRSMPMTLAFLRQVALLIPRRWLRRIAGVRGRLLALLQFQFQGFIVRSQSLQLCKLRKDQIDQIVAAHLSQVISGHRDPSLPYLAVFA
jgi:hypothetical protein